MMRSTTSIPNMSWAGDPSGRKTYLRMVQISVTSLGIIARRIYNGEAANDSNTSRAPMADGRWALAIKNNHSVLRPLPARIWPAGYLVQKHFFEFGSRATRSRPQPLDKTQWPLFSRNKWHR